MSKIIIGSDNVSVLTKNVIITIRATTAVQPTAIPIIAPIDELLSSVRMFLLFMLRFDSTGHFACSAVNE